MIIQYNKLVRDRIPEIIEASGNACVTEILSDDSYLEMLDKKLDEELAEYHKDQNIEELSDLLEVIHACAVARGYTLDNLEKVRADKAAKRGGFDKKILLKSVKDDSVEISQKAVEIAKKINANQAAIINHLTEKSMQTYCDIQHLFMNVNIAESPDYRKKFGGFYRMRFVTQEYRDAFFKLFEESKRKSDIYFAKLSLKLYPVNNKHEFSFISKMIHTIDPQRPIYDNQVAAVLGLKRKQNFTLEARIQEDNEILLEISRLYEELEQSHLIDEPLDTFTSKFRAYPVPISKKIDFMLWALGSGKI